MNRYTMLLPSFLATILLASCVLSGTARAQRISHRPRPAGGITGLELGLDGATTAELGSSLRWFFTLYEVVGQDRLRPSRTGRLRVLASFDPEEPIAELRTDAHGRAEVEIPLPDSHPGSFEVVVEARANRVTRTFRMSVTPTSPGRVELVVDRERAQPGELVTVVGRIILDGSGRPAVNRDFEIRVTDSDGRTVEEQELQTGSAGAFVTTVDVPQGTPFMNVTPLVPGHTTSSARVIIETPAHDRLVARAVPRQQVVGLGVPVTVDVVVRRADGRPVKNAHVALVGTPPSKTKNLTDVMGRAQVVWQSPSTQGAAIADLTHSISAERAGLGATRAPFSVRVARVPFQIGAAVEGGSLTPGLPCRLYLRVAGPDSEPAPGVPVRIEGPLVGALSGETDDAGVVVLDSLPVVRAGLESRDRCGGATASSATITVGAGESRVVLERCIPIDPDGTVRVRTGRSILAAGEELQVELLTTTPVARAPIELVLLRRSGQQLHPVARRVSPARAGTRQLTFTIPRDVVGDVVLRARPLIGAALDPVRGGTAAVWVTTGPRADLSVGHEGGTASAVLSRERDGAQGTLFVVPRRDAGPLLQRLTDAMQPEFARFLADPATALDSEVQGLLAARTPRDDAAPAVLRNGTVVVMPAPDEPTQFGVLRDPVRSRARFVRGRLALVVRSIESQLEASIPERIDDVGVRSGGRWTFNREALKSVVGAHLLRRRPPRTLGGDPLTLADLEAFDSSFTFDNMARRVTRERLLQLLVQLRDFVRTRELDLWQGSGDPALWLQLLVEDNGLEESALHDAWGRAMTIRRAPRGQARFRFLMPLPAGYELLSAGPDGRFGTGDDLYDPFARVLPSGTPYAEAVAEDDLLARLQRVEISQATIDEVVSLCEVSSEQQARGAGPTALGSWGIGLAPLAPPVEVEQFERFWLPVERGRASPVLLSQTQRVPLGLGEEPRELSLIGLAWTSAGWFDGARRLFRAGFPVILTAEPLERVRRGEMLTVPVAVARLPGGPDALLLSANATGEAVAAEIRGQNGDGPLPLDPGGGAEAELQIEGRSLGDGVVQVRVRAADGSGQRTVSLPIRVHGPGILRVQSAAGAATRSLELAVQLPRDATNRRGSLVIARPDAFVGDPALSTWYERDPALVAWALSVSGQELPTALLRRLESATARNGTVRGEHSGLSNACATVAWASATEGVHWAQRATVNALSGQGRNGGASRDLGAARLAALSVAAAPDDDSPLSRTMAALRDELRAGVRRHRTHPSMLARGAAALLLIDRRDVRGLTMLALARQQLEPGFRGGRVVRVGDGGGRGASGRSGAEQLVATAALAIAAHQADEPELARQLARGLAARAHVATALGGEPLFWFLAARAFGVFGVAEEVSVTVEQGGERREIELGAEAVVLPLQLPEPGRRATLRVEPRGDGTALPLVRSTAYYVRPADSVENGPLRANLEGDPGFTSERAAYVLTLSNTASRRVDRPVILVTLPPGAQLDETARNAILQADGVTRVWRPDGRGVVRIDCSTLYAAPSFRIPLPIRWTAAGRRRGLSIAVFQADRAWELSVTEPTRLDIQARPEDEE